MIDVYDITNNQINEQVFYTRGALVWQTWSKPRGCKYVSILAIGGGGGGGGGTSAVGAANTGGSGGACSPISRGTFISHTLPDTLYISVGPGGTGGNPGGNGTAGNISYIAVLPSSTTPVSVNVLLASSNTAPAGGTSNGVATGTPTSFSSANGFLANLGIFTIIAGQAGFATNLPATILFPLTSGAGGGSTSNVGPTSTAGGNVTGAGFVPTIPGGAAGVNGGNGYGSMTPSSLSTSKLPFFNTGGAGGGGLFAGTGGNGGDGSFGCGGGGAGAGTTGGRGGKGGDGIVIITAW